MPFQENSADGDSVDGERNSFAHGCRGARRIENQRHRLIRYCLPCSRGSVGDVGPAKLQVLSLVTEIAPHLNFDGIQIGPAFPVTLVRSERSALSCLPFGT